MRHNKQTVVIILEHRFFRLEFKSLSIQLYKEAIEENKSLLLIQVSLLLLDEIILQTLVNINIA